MDCRSQDTDLHALVPLIFLTTLVFYFFSDFQTHSSLSVIALSFNMLVFPNCKINLGLHILRKREDGFHDIETVFYPLKFTDVLEVIPNKQNDIPVEFTGTGLVVDGPADDNLCCRAYHLLKKDFPQLPAVKMHLHKVIPTGAGLGGGSADAAFMLKWLNDQFKLSLSTEQLISYSLQLGSDCPFFIINKPCYATSRGEMLLGISLDLSAFKIVLVNPGIHISTGWAFSQIAPAQTKKSINEIIHQHINTWKAELKNDFEKAVFAAHPEIQYIKEALYQQGAVYAALSGSGSTVFGIFDRDISEIHFTDKAYFTKIII